MPRNFTGLEESQADRFFDLLNGAIFDQPLARSEMQSKLEAFRTGPDKAFKAYMAKQVLKIPPKIAMAVFDVTQGYVSQAANASTNAYTRVNPESTRLSKLIVPGRSYTYNLAFTQVNDDEGRLKCLNYLAHLATLQMREAPRFQNRLVASYCTEDQAKEIKRACEAYAVALQAGTPRDQISRFGIGRSASEQMSETMEAQDLDRQFVDAFNVAGGNTSDASKILGLMESRNLQVKSILDSPPTVVKIQGRRTGGAEIQLGELLNMKRQIDELLPNRNDNYVVIEAPFNRNGLFDMSIRVADAYDEDFTPESSGQTQREQESQEPSNAILDRVLEDFDYPDRSYVSFMEKLRDLNGEIESVTEMLRGETEVPGDEDDVVALSLIITLPSGEARNEEDISLLKARARVLRKRLMGGTEGEERFDGIQPSEWPVTFTLPPFHPANRDGRGVIAFQIMDYALAMSDAGVGPFDNPPVGEETSSSAQAPAVFNSPMLAMRVRTEMNGFGYDVSDTIQKFITALRESRLLVIAAMRDETSQGVKYLDITAKKLEGAAGISAIRSRVYDQAFSLIPRMLGGRTNYSVQNAGPGEVSIILSELNAEARQRLSSAPTQTSGTASTTTSQDSVMLNDVNLVQEVDVDLVNQVGGTDGPREVAREFASLSPTLRKVLGTRTESLTDIGNGINNYAKFRIAGYSQSQIPQILDFIGSRGYYIYDFSNTPQNASGNNRTPVVALTLRPLAGRTPSAFQTRTWKSTIARATGNSDLLNRSADRFRFTTFRNRGQLGFVFLPLSESGLERVRRLQADTGARRPSQGQSQPLGGQTEMVNSHADQTSEPGSASVTRGLPFTTVASASLNLLTFGWELEFYHPFGNRNMLVRKLNEALPAGAIKFRNGPAKSTPVNGGLHGIVRDVSAEKPSGAGKRKFKGETPRYEAAEFGSCILQGEKGLKQIEYICEAFMKCGIRVNASHGLHVHFDAHGRSPSKLKAMNAHQLSNLVVNYTKLQDVIDAMQPIPRIRRDVNGELGRGSKWSRSFTKNEVRRYVEFANDPSTKNDNLKLYRDLYGGDRAVRSWGPGASYDHYHQSRYRTVNLHAMVFRTGTVEYRQGGPTTDYLVVTNWVLFLYYLTLLSYKRRANVSGGIKSQWQYCETFLPDSVATFWANEITYVEGLNPEQSFEGSAGNDAGRSRRRSTL